MACKGCKKSILDKATLEKMSTEELVDKFFAIDSKNTVLCKIVNKKKDVRNKKTKEELLLTDKQKIIDSFLVIQNENIKLIKKLIEDRRKNNPLIKKKVSEEEIGDVNDIHAMRHGRTIHEGKILESYVKNPPMIFSREGHSMYFEGMFRGRSAFLISGGPSFSSVNKELLDKPGVLTMSINNSVKSFRSNLWISVDDPTHFIKSVWLDSKIMKFVPYSHSEKTIFDNEKWEETNIKVGGCPNIWFYKRNEKFIAKQFLIEDTFNWGNHKKYGGGRSVMLPALRVLFYLGIRKVFLLGVDFKMDKNNKYHFEQDRTKSSVNGNNNTYKKLIDRFNELKPIFDKNGFEVYNCYKDSGLKTFPFMDFEEAIRIATEEMPQNILSERTKGLYERKVNENKD